MNDFRFAFRQLLKNPGFTAVAVLTLAVCLGVNLAIFALVDAVLVRPLPFPEPDLLMTMFNTYPKAGIERNGASLANYYERRGNVPAFSTVAIHSQGTAIIGDAGSTEQMELMRVSPEFFTTPGVGPVMGRTFADEEMTYQTDGVAILADTCWRHRFNGDPHILGRHIGVDGAQKAIVGVLPPAQPTQIGRQFLSLGLRLLATGTALGILGAWMAGRAMQRVLFDVPTLPLATVAGTAVVMTIVSLAACLLPILRASRVDPMEALRYE